MASDFELHTSDGGTASLDLGILFAGTSPSVKLLKIKNVSGATTTGCRIVCSNSVYQDASGPFASQAQDGTINPLADADAAGNTVTFLAGSSAGLVNLLVDDIGPDVVDADGDTIYSGRDLAADGTTQYRVADGDPLQGFKFALNSDVTAASTGTLHASDGGDCTRLQNADASDDAFGPDGIVATQSGQTAGTILNNGEVEFGLQFDASLAKDAGLNPRYFSLRIVGTKSAAETVTEFTGTFKVVRYNSQHLIWQISVRQPNYPVPHFDEDGTPNDNGDYIKDAFGNLVIDTGGGEGQYKDWKTVLAENGVTIT